MNDSSNAAGMDNRRDRLRLVGVVAAVFVGIVLLLTSLSKLVHPAGFLADVYSYGIVGRTLGLILGHTIPWVELVVGAALISRILTRGALLTAAALFGVFVLGQGLVLLRGELVSCGCGLPGMGDDTVGTWSLTRTSAFFALTGLAYFALHRTKREFVR